jgi:peptidyl-prolyl cis-trans isomerase D
MIRFLQKDNRVVKAIFVVIISVACITMVITLVPGVFQDQTTNADTYATVRGGGLLGRYLGVSSSEITTARVQQTAMQMLQRNHYPEMALPFIMQRVGQSLIQQAIILQEADRLGLQVTDDDLRRFLHTGMFGQVLFPGGQYIGDARYAQIIQDEFGISRKAFEDELKQEMEANRLKAFVTGGVTVSDSEIRQSYKEQGTKIKFQYAVLSTDDLGKTINPTDTELQAFFKQSAVRYANAVPESRKIQYIAVSQGQLPGGVPPVTDQETQQYYNQHQSEFRVDDQVKARHILIQVARGADAKTDAAARQKANDLLKQIKAGADFADLAKKNSDDPGSKGSGGELGFMKHGTTVPDFDKALFSIQPGQTEIVRTPEFGYHILQIEEKQNAHLKSLDEVKAQIVASLTRQKEEQLGQNFAAQVAAEAQKNGMSKAADAHHLQLITTDYVQQAGIIPGLADGSKVLSQSFASKPGSAPQVASTGEGFAVFQVTDAKAAHAPAFDEYKSHILQDFREQQLPQLLASKTNELADRAKAGNDFEKAAKEAGATVKTSDLVGREGQVPDVGQLATAAPQLFSLNPGQVSGAINTGRTGIVAKLLQKNEPAADEIAKNFDQTRDGVLSQRREEMFSVFSTNLVDRYQKEKRIRVNVRTQSPLQPGQPS